VSQDEVKAEARFHCTIDRWNAGRSATAVSDVALLRARFFQKVLRLAWAVVLCAAAVAAQDAPVQADLKRAVELQQAGKYAAAIEAYRAILRARPDAAGVRPKLGDALAREGRFAEAIREYTAALGSEPSNIGVRSSLGLIYYKSGDFLHAAEQFEKVRAALVADSDEGARISKLLADCYLRRGEGKEAIKVLDPVADSRPDDLAAAYLLGMALLQEKQEEQAVHVLERIMSRDDTAEGRLLLATRKMQAVELKGALRDILRCLELKPDWAEAHVIHGRLLMMTADLAGAEAAFRRALAADPNSFDALLELSSLDREQGKLAEAREALVHALSIRTADIPATYQLALVESADNRDDRAVELLESVVKEAPNFQEAHIRLATLYYRLHRPEDGRRERQIVDRLATEKQKRNLDREQTTH
jgi:tetratricopeptide (TPR) repeat protein